MNSEKEDQHTHDPYFTPLDSEGLGVPESITGNKQEKNKAFDLEDSSVDSEAGYLKWPLFGFLSLGGALLIWQCVELYFYLLSVHWAFAFLYGFMVCLILLFSIKGLFFYVRSLRSLDSANELRLLSRQMLETRSIIQKPFFLSKFKKHYKRTAQYNLLEDAVDTLPDYCEDAEAIIHLDNHFLSELDQTALRAVARCSRDNAILIGLSPFVLADILLSLWRTMKMISEVAKAYGVAPTFLGRIRLTRKLLHQMAVTAGADFLADQIMDFTSNTLASTLSKQAATGVGVGLYTMRIGFYSMSLCRPIPFQKDNSPSFKKILNDIMKSMRKK